MRMRLKPKNRTVLSALLSVIAIGFGECLVSAKHPPLVSPCWDMKGTRGGAAFHRPSLIVPRMPSQCQLHGHNADEQSDDSLLPTTTETEENHVVVNSMIELPFSAELAYDCFSDLPRQPEWSPWLKSVEYLSDQMGHSKWTMKILGAKFSWIAISGRNERPKRIEWESISGLRNFGQVDFVQNEVHTEMHLKMTFKVPRMVALLFRGDDTRLKRSVEKRVLYPLLQNFKEVVVEDNS